MNVKEKLGKLVNIINTTNEFDEHIASNQLDEIVWEFIKEIDYHKIDYNCYLKTEIKLDYQDFINVWYSFVKKRILEINEKSLINSIPDKSSLKISLFENELSIKLEKLFEIHLDCIDDDLLLFYLRGDNKILLMYKSYQPLEHSDNIRLPFWQYIIEHPKIKDKFENVFKKDTNLCILGYTI